MKKLTHPLRFALSLAFIAVSAIVFYACTKDTMNDSTNLTQAPAPEMAGTPTGVSVNEDYHFLVFSSTSAAETFMEDLRTMTHYDAKKYFEELEVNPLGAEIYDGTYDDSLVTDEQLKDYLLNENSIVQIQNTIIKPIDNDDYILAMREDYLQASTHEYLVAGSYDEYSMNKFATHFEDLEEPEDGIFKYMEDYPIGFEAETVNNSRPRIKFWGWNNIGGQFAGPCEDDPQHKCNCIYQYQRHTIFWTWDGKDRTLEVDRICEE